MEQLITALKIFRKYGNPTCPTHCEHDVLYVIIDPNIVSEQDKQKLNSLGFFASTEFNAFASFRFGSA